MYNRMKSLLMCFLLAAGILMLSAVKTEAASDTCKIKFIYDSSLAKLTLYDMTAKKAIKNGESLPITSSGRTNYISAQLDVREGYRIISVKENGEDKTSIFVDGLYGGMSKSYNVDTTYEVVIEKIPAYLPQITGVKIYSGIWGNLNLVGNRFQIDSSTFKLWAFSSFDDDFSLPYYFAEGEWEFSLDGSVWDSFISYGWRTGLDLWPTWNGWSERLPFDFVSTKNYYLRIKLTGRKGYSQGKLYSAPILINGSTSISPTPTAIPGIVEPEIVTLPDSVSVNVGETIRLKPVLTPVTSTTNFQFSSSDASIASVTDTGLVTGLKKGSATITVTTANGKQATTTVKVVYPKPSKITISQGKRYTLKVGKKLKLKYVLTPENAKTTVKWKSSKKSVATVNQKTGTVKARKAGVAKIKVVTANKKKATIIIYVKD